MKIAQQNPLDVCRDLDALDSEFREKLEMVLADADRAGLAPRVIETYRSQARQDYLYAAGRTRPGSIVTRAKISRHTSRRAADVCPTVGGEIVWSRTDLFEALGKIAESHGLVWGGRFQGFFDGAHLEMPEQSQPQSAQNSR